MTKLREATVAELRERVGLPFVLHQVDPEGTDRAWVHGRAGVTQTRRGRPGTVDGPTFTCLGPPEDLVPLMTALAAAGERPARLTVEDASYADVPPAWAYERHGHWHWMLTTHPCPEPEAAVEEVADDAEVEAVLDEANPGSFARPGGPDIECWLGIRDAGRLVATGALRREHNGTGHLRGVSVLPSHAGRGLGRALSAALTRRALAGASGVATLGVYVDNAPALAIYHRLGYAIAHTFSSGPVNSESRAPAGG